MFTEVSADMSERCTVRCGPESRAVATARSACAHNAVESVHARTTPGNQGPTSKRESPMQAVKQARPKVGHRSHSGEKVEKCCYFAVLLLSLCLILMQLGLTGKMFTSSSSGI